MYVGKGALICGNSKERKEGLYAAKDPLFGFDGVSVLLPVG